MLRLDVFETSVTEKDRSKMDVGSTSSTTKIGWFKDAEGYEVPKGFSASVPLGCKPLDCCALFGSDLFRHRHRAGPNSNRLVQ